MKKIIFGIFLVLCFNIYPQVTEDWNPIYTTVIPTIAAENIALFANNYGIHLLQTIPSDPNKPVKYFRLKSTGELDEGITVDGIVIDAYGKFPNLTGDENNLYAFYQKGNNIQVKKSTNGGNTWISEASYPFSNGSTVSNGVDAIYNNEKGLNIVWSQKEGSIYESYFARRYNGQWLDYTQITNHSTLESGGFPTVTTSNINGTQKAHVSINTGVGDAVNSNSGQNFSRDFDYSSWADPIQILPSGTLSMVDRLLVTNDGMMHCFYYTPPAAASRFEYKKKSIESGTWSEPLIITDLNKTVQMANVEKIEITKTAKEMLHAFWMGYSYPWGFNHKEKSSSSTSWSSIFEINGGVNQRELATTSSSNDLYVIFSQNYSVPTLRYRQYDAVPFTPANFTGTTYNNHPKLTWTIKEADIEYFEIYWQLVNDAKRPGAWNLLTTTSNTSFVDNGVQLGGAEWGDVNYKIRSKDYSDYYSPYTSIITFGYSGLNKTVASNDLNEYKLFSNYPNPFNPSTKISYSIKEEGLVIIKVYDVLGKEIAILVNENKPVGIYEAEFNASQLPSGMYIYKLQAGSFTDVKKMLLTK